MSDLNLVILRGTISTDIKSIGSEEKPAISFSLATNEYAGKENDEIVSFHQIVVNRPHHVKYLSEYAKKGDPISVEGNIRYSQKDEKYYTNIRMESFDLGYRRPKENAPEDK